ncbi:MAG: sulfotransferase [Bacteroidota bacterium]|nr:sulfotransferase [Bacteroidota bacterium]
MESLLDSQDLSPIFIVGMPRSGTKLIREILNRNENIFIPKSESIFIPYLIKKYGAIPDFTSVNNRKKIINDLRKSTYCYNMSITKTQLYSKSFVEVLKSNCWAIIFRYILNNLVNNNKNKVLFGDKTPSYINHLELLSKIYPNAKILHITRDPRDQALSSRNIWKKNLYRNAQRWRDSIVKCRKSAKKYKINYLEIKYEHLINSPELIMQKVCNYVGCTYTKSMLVFKGPIESFGDANELYINKNNLNKFLIHLTDCQIKMIEELTLDVMSSLDYKTVHKNISIRRLNILENSIYKLLDICNILRFQILQKGIFRGLRYAYYLNKQNKSHSLLNG